MGFISINLIIKSNKLLFSLLIISMNIISPSLIKIPFKILKFHSPPNQRIEKTVEDMTFFFKLFSLIDIGDPPQKIEASFDLKLSNYFISNNCRNCSTFYSYKKSNSIKKIDTDRTPIGFGYQFYAYETFNFYDGKNNRQKKVENMMIYLPRLNEDESNDKNNRLKNCITIGLKFPDNIYNNFQKSFIQQLKQKNVINQYLWTMIFYDNKYNKDYDGAFIFGDILNDFYPYINNENGYSIDKVVYTYTGNRKKKNSKRNNALEWGIQFDKIYYEFSNNYLNTSNPNNTNNIVYIHRLITEFNFNINAIYATFEYSRNIQKDYFNFYYNKNICKYTFMRGSMYKFIYCYTKNFTQKDLEKFPSLNFKNNILRYIFTLDYKDLFSLTFDKKYYIFNIMIVNIYQGDENDGGHWVLGLPFWRKYQFSFDIDNKLIYFYNKKGNFLDEVFEEENYFDYEDEKNKINEKTNNISSENENFGNNTELGNNQKIIIKDKKLKNNSNKKEVEIKIEKIILFIILIIFFIFLFSILLILVKKILFKKGFILMRIKKANELSDDDYDYSSKNINFIKNEKNIKPQECEMQIK